MPADDLVLNVRQIAGYPDGGAAAPSDTILLQRGGLGGPYFSLDAEAFVSTALASGGPMEVGFAAPPDAIGGQVFANGLVSPPAGFWSMNAYENDAGVTCRVGNGPAALISLAPAGGWNFASGAPGGGLAPITWVDQLQISPTGYLTVGDQILLARDPTGPMEAATVQYVAATTVASFNGRTGNVRLMVDDIICGGGAPIFSPSFQGSPRASTPPPWSNSGRIATTAFVQMALASAVDLTGYAPLASPAFSGVPTAPTAPVGSSDGQLATTAFVMNAVAASTTGVVSFNSRTGIVVLTGADLTGAGGAMLASPAFTGNPSAPTAVAGTATTQIATTAFVMAAVAAATAGVSSFNGRTGIVTLTAADIAAVGVSTFNGRFGAVNLIANDVSAVGGAMLNSPAFTGSPTAPTAAPGSTTTQLATCAFVTAAIATVSGVSSFNSRTGAVTLTTADVTGVGGALLASPVFTGSPQAPTATAGTSTAQLATTAFVMNAVASATAGVASFNTRTGAVTLIANDISGAGGALLASPAFTGNPSAPTAVAGTATTQIATTAFVMAAISAPSNTPPLMDGAASAGSSAAWSRGDHVHPTDTSRAAVTALASYLPLAGGTLTGLLTPSGIAGIATNSAAAAGVIGEWIVSNVSTGVGIVTGTVSAVTSISLTPGDWQVEGWVQYTLSATATNVQAAVNSSIALPPASLGGLCALVGPSFGTGSCLPTGGQRYLLSATTTIYLVAWASFSGTCTVQGSIHARRMR